MVHLQQLQHTNRLANVTHFLSDKLSSVTEWSEATEQMHFWILGWKIIILSSTVVAIYAAARLTLHEFGGTSSCVISPACTQNRCSNEPLYKSHKQTAKSTPPESRWDLSYLQVKKWQNTSVKMFNKKQNKKFSPCVREWSALAKRTWNEPMMDTTSN